MENPDMEEAVGAVRCLWGKCHAGGAVVSWRDCVLIWIGRVKNQLAFDFIEDWTVVRPKSQACGTRGQINIGPEHGAVRDKIVQI